MKRLIFAAAGLSALVALGVYMNRTNVPAIAAPETAAESAANQSPDEAQSPTPIAAVAEVPLQHAVAPEASASDSRSPAPVPLAPTARKDLQLGVAQSIGTLLSPVVPFEQKQKTWKELRKAGKLDQTITDLEQRAGADSQSAETIAALGQAYWQKCAAIDDIREQAILVMKADEAFDTALKLDPLNWEARFTKALAMSYWPAELNKGNEVIEQFRTLIDQQESQLPQPQFAQPYLRLGDQYVKSGHPDVAAQIWQRGAALFPDDADLKKKLAAAMSSQ